jgi:ABC-type polysaccharide transport system, permease component
MLKEVKILDGAAAGLQTQNVKSNRTKFQKKMGLVKKNRLYYLLIIPGLLFFIIFKYVPMYGIVIAFKDVMPFDGVKEMLSAPWVGFKHFLTFISSYYFPQLMRNTLVISLLKIIFGFPAPIIFALLLNEVKNLMLKRTIQTISYMPHFISLVVLAGLTVTLLTTDGGIINQIITQLGGEPIFFLGDNRYFKGVIVATSVWKEMGWNAIIYLAAIVGVDPQQYEAAIMDGAGKLKQIWYITLPSISDIVVIMFIFAIGGILDAGFEQIFLLYSQPVYETGDIIDTYVYRRGLEQMDYSYATAIGFFKSVIAFILIFAANLIAKKFDKEGIW